MKNFFEIILNLAKISIFKGIALVIYYREAYELFIFLLFTNIFSLLENFAKIKSLKKDFDLELENNEQESKTNNRDWDVVNRVIIGPGEQQLEDDLKNMMNK